MYAVCREYILRHGGKFPYILCVEDVLDQCAPSEYMNILRTAYYVFLISPSNFSLQAILTDLHKHFISGIHILNSPYGWMWILLSVFSWVWSLGEFIRKSSWNRSLCLTISFIVMGLNLYVVHMPYINEMNTVLVKNAQ